MRYAWIKERVMWTEQIRINRQWSDHRANNCLRERTQIRAKGAATTRYHQTSLGAEGDAAAKLGRARNGTTGCDCRTPYSGLGQRESGGTKRKGLQVCPIANGHDEVGRFGRRSYVACLCSLPRSPTRAIQFRDSRQHSLALFQANARLVHRNVAFFIYIFFAMTLRLLTTGISCLYFQKYHIKFMDE